MDALLGAAIDLAAFLLLSVGSAVIVPIGARIAEWLKLQSDAQVRGYLLGVLERAVEYGQGEARRRLGAADPAERRALEVALARDYVADRVPDALARFSLGLTDVEQMVRARLPKPPVTPFAG